MVLGTLIYDRDEEYHNGEFWERNNIRALPNKYLFKYSTYDNPYDMPSRHITENINEIIELLPATEFNVLRELKAHKYPYLCTIQEVWRKIEFNELWG